MFDTNIVIIGNILTAPEWRRTTTTGALVANFKIASTARRLDRETGRWVDGNSLRVRVNCWRKLAEGVASSVMVGDPVVVAGRLYTRDWTDADGNPRTMYEMEAVAIGHDLARGRSSFRRNRPAPGTSAVEDAESSAQVHGAPADALAEEDIPVRYGDGVFDEEQPHFDEVPPRGPDEHDPMAAIRGGGFEPDDVPHGVRRPDDASDAVRQPGGEARTARRPNDESLTVRQPGDESHPVRQAGDASQAERQPGGESRSPRRPDVDGWEPAHDEPGRTAGEPAPTGEGDGEEPPPRRPRRNGRRIPVPA